MVRRWANGKNPRPGAQVQTTNLCMCQDTGEHGPLSQNFDAKLKLFLLGPLSVAPKFSYFINTHVFIKLESTNMSIIHFCLYIDLNLKPTVRHCSFLCLAFVNRILLEQ